jgi:ectoine hydroxylase-related dioxygenase (phytanoyl-CoA dioxygenase family)
MLSPHQLAALDRAGYVVVPDALEPARVARLLLAFERAPVVAGTQHVPLSDATPELGSWRALELDPLVRAAADHVLGRAHLVRDLHGRNPTPGFGQQGLHSDWMPRVPGSSYFVVTAIWMLDGFTRTNGATRVVPGSHRHPGAVPKPYAQPLAAHRDETIVTGGPGTALIFNGHLWHSGTRNASGSARRAVQMTVVAAGAGG